MLHTLRCIVNLGVRSVKTLLFAILMFALGAGAGYLGKPAIQKHLAAYVLQYTGVDIGVPAEPVEEVIEVVEELEEPKTIHFVDIPERYYALKYLVIAVGPNGVTTVQLPAGLEALVASGATHLIKIRILERSKTSYAKVKVLILELGTEYEFGIGGVSKYEVEITKVVYPKNDEEEEPTEDEDGF